MKWKIIIGISVIGAAIAFAEFKAKDQKPNFTVSRTV
jgi:mannose/fructose/N-acetylgalactosamine-specific phosphotransferase system component IIC